MNFIKKAIERWRAKRAMKKALPVIIKLLNDPDFVKFANNEGYQFDVEAIFKAFIDASGWKGPSPIQKVR